MINVIHVMKEDGPTSHWLMQKDHTLMSNSNLKSSCNYQTASLPAKTVSERFLKKEYIVLIDRSIITHFSSILFIMNEVYQAYSAFVHLCVSISITDWAIEKFELDLV